LIVGVIARPKSRENKTEVIVSIKELSIFALEGLEGVVVVYERLV
jgi:hypothetical protein